MVNNDYPGERNSESLLYIFNSFISMYCFIIRVFSKIALKRSKYYTPKVILILFCVYSSIQTILNMRK